MAHFDKTSKEYISNGHYKIDDKDFMSIWTFKNEYSMPRNEPEINEKEGDELFSNTKEDHTCKNEVGKKDKSHIYPVDELIAFYSNYSL